MSYVIRIMYGDSKHIQRFRFDTDNTSNPDEKFDEAVKEINKLYSMKQYF